jgi:hypothetical protein
MSNTRHAKDASRFHQNRYASSAEFERGLLANLVAKRCALIDCPLTREAIWFIQYLSHQNGGTAKLAKDLIEKYPHEIQTKEMAELKLKPGQFCNSDKVKKIRAGLPHEEAMGFMLKGEVWNNLLNEILPDRQRDAKEMVEANKKPTSYPAKNFFDLCLFNAQRYLEKALTEICLNPESDTVTGPWYFPNLFAVLRQYQAEHQKSKAPAFTTSLGANVSGVLDYTSFTYGLTLMEGEARTGKSFAARVWCEQRPGEARFAEVPSGNDEAGFFRALARALGLGNFLSYKACEIRERVESVLLTRDLLLVLDEAQRLWPQRNLRYGFPSRITWVTDLYRLHREP